MSAYEMFDAMSAGIQEDTVRLLFHVKVEQKVEREEVAKAVSYTHLGIGCRWQ